MSQSRARCSQVHEHRWTARCERASETVEGHTSALTRAAWRLCAGRRGAPQSAHALRGQRRHSTCAASSRARRSCAAALWPAAAQLAAGWLRRSRGASAALQALLSLQDGGLLLQGASSPGLAGAQGGVQGGAQEGGTLRRQLKALPKPPPEPTRRCRAAPAPSPPQARAMQPACRALCARLAFVVSTSSLSTGPPASVLLCAAALRAVGAVPRARHGHRLAGRA